MMGPMMRPAYNKLLGVLLRNSSIHPQETPIFTRYLQYLQVKTWSCRFPLKPICCYPDSSQEFHSMCSFSKRMFEGKMAGKAWGIVHYPLKMHIGEEMGCTHTDIHYIYIHIYRLYSVCIGIYRPRCSSQNRVPPTPMDYHHLSH